MMIYLKNVKSKRADGRWIKSVLPCTSAICHFTSYLLYHSLYRGSKNRLDKKFRLNLFLSPSVSKQSVSESLISRYVFILSSSLNEKSTPVSFLARHGSILITSVLRKETDFRGLFRGLSSTFTPLSIPYTTLNMTFRPAFVTSTG